MKSIRHATTNYKMLIPFLEAVNASEEHHRRFTASGFMPLSMESLECSDYKDRPIYSISHYGEQNGDLMADPDMEIAVDFSAGKIEPRTFRNDYLGVYQEVYRRQRDGNLAYSPSLRSALDEFLWQWLHNIQEQGFTPEIYERQPIHQPPHSSGVDHLTLTKV